MEDLSKAVEILKNSQNLIITTHINPDGDALGSVLAIYHYAKELGKNVHIFINDEVPYNYRFLDDFEKIQKFNPDSDTKYIEQSDTILVVDVNDSKRLKCVEESIINSQAIKVVIDHHLEPKEFADFYFVDSEACSAGEIIWEMLIKDPDFKCNNKIASALYTAIMTDTGSFRYPRTDSRVHRIIADLIDCGADPVYIYNEVYNRNPIKITRLLGVGYSGLESYYNGMLCIMTLKRDDFIKTETTSEDVEGFVEELHSINGVKIGILMTEMLNNSEIRVSFRSKGDISVRDIAMEFGGGGHFHAAGARVKNIDFDNLKQKVIERVGKVLS